MGDIFDATILCEDCEKKTERGVAMKEGFQLRYWKCPECGRQWYHPSDLKEYEDFNKLRQREFSVKLRMVGNSWAVSIPREIIDFHNELEQEMASHFERFARMKERMDRMVRLCLEQPGKISLFFINKGKAEKGKEESVLKAGKKKAREKGVKSK
ncbi:MAG: hypothetical protein QW559_02260 [Candidatus Woesearchaeota archaeon]